MTVSLMMLIVLAALRTVFALYSRHPLGNRPSYFVSTLRKRSPLVESEHRTVAATDGGSSIDCLNSSVCVCCALMKKVCVCNANFAFSIELYTTLNTSVVVLLFFAHRTVGIILVSQGDAPLPTFKKKCLKL